MSLVFKIKRSSLVWQKNTWVNYEIVYYEIIANYIIMLLSYAGGLINGLYMSSSVLTSEHTINICQNQFKIFKINLESSFDILIVCKCKIFCISLILQSFSIPVWFIMSHPTMSTRLRNIETLETDESFIQ